MTNTTAIVGGVIVVGAAGLLAWALSRPEPTTYNPYYAPQYPPRVQSPTQDLGGIFNAVTNMLGGLVNAGSKLRFREPEDNRPVEYDPEAAFHGSATMNDDGSGFYGDGV